jgi:hypothetical protein
MRHSHCPYLYILLLLLLPQTALSQSTQPRSTEDPGAITTVTVDGASTKEDPREAATESLRDAHEKGLLQVIESLVRNHHDQITNSKARDKKREKDQNTIKNKVLPQATKAIVYYKQKDPVRRAENGGETVTQVTMQISVQILRDLLRTHGLLSNVQTTAAILPLVRINDNRLSQTRKFTWWTEEPTSSSRPAAEQFRAMVKQLDGPMRSHGLHLIDPLTQHLFQNLPESYRQEFLTQDDAMKIAQFERAQIVLLGDLTLEPNTKHNGVRQTIKLSALSVPGSRVMGDVTKSIEVVLKQGETPDQISARRIAANIAEDFSSQLADQWNRGTFGAAPLRLTIRGAPTPKELEAFKTEVLEKLKEVKVIRERRQTAGNYTFELDILGDRDFFIKKFSSIRFVGAAATASIDDSDENTLTLSWSKI